MNLKRHIARHAQFADLLLQNANASHGSDGKSVLSISKKTRALVFAKLTSQQVSALSAFLERTERGRQKQRQQQQQQWAMDVKARRDAMWAPFRAMLAELARLAPDTLSQFLSMQGETRELLREMCGGVLSKEQWDSFVEYQRRLKKEGLMRGAARTSLGLSEYKFKKLSAGFEIEPDGKLWLASISDWVAAYFPETIERLKQKQPAREKARP